MPPSPCFLTKFRTLRVTFSAWYQLSWNCCFAAIAIVSQVLKCQLRDFVERNPGYTSFLAQRQGLSDHNLGSGVVSGDYAYTSAGGSFSSGGSGQGNADDAAQVETGQGLVVFWERAVGSRLAEMFRWESIVGGILL